MKVFLNKLDGTVETTKLFRFDTEITIKETKYKFDKFIGPNYDGAVFKEKIEENWP